MYHFERNKFRPKIVYTISSLALLASIQTTAVGMSREDALIGTLGLTLTAITAIPCWLAWLDFGRWLHNNWPRLSAAWNFPLTQFIVSAATLLGCELFARVAPNYIFLLYFIAPMALLRVVLSILGCVELLGTVSGQHLPWAKAMGFWVLTLAGIGFSINMAGFRDIGNLVIGLAVLVLIVDLIGFFNNREEYRQEGGRISLSLIGLALFIAGSAAWVLTDWSL